MKIEGEKKEQKSGASGAMSNEDPCIPHIPEPDGVHLQRYVCIDFGWNITIRDLKYRNTSKKLKVIGFISSFSYTV